jgi:hypothetical protein
MAESSDARQLGVEFTADVYRAVALERAGALRGLYEDEEFGLAIYTAGLAVESIFRAYRTLFDPEFSSRHNLSELAKEARFSEVVPERLREKYAADLGAVVARWSNNHRYRPEATMRRYLKKAKLDRGIKGDFLKENARRIVNAALSLVTLGDQLWKN